MNFIALDASTEACSVAILFNGEVFHQFELCPQSHSLVLLPMVDELLKKANCSLADMDALIYGQGPGSFTGVRIGVGVAQGLAFACDLPTIGVSSMQAMAQQVFETTKSSNIQVAIDARMSEIYTARYQANEKGVLTLQGREAVIPPGSLKATYEGDPTVAGDIIGAGTGWQAYQKDLSTLCSNSDNINVMYPDAKYMLTLGEVAFNQGLAKPAEQAQPCYVRDTVSWKKLPGRE